jgi:hypothetical protein
LKAPEGDCEVFTNLRLARSGFLFGHVLAFTALVLWGHTLIHGWFNNTYGAVWLNRAYILSAPLFYLLGIVYWFDRSEATFDAECDEAKDTEADVPEMCATVGPSLAIFTYILM